MTQQASLALTLTAMLNGRERDPVEDEAHRCIQQIQQKSDDVTLITSAIFDSVKRLVGHNTAPIDQEPQFTTQERLEHDFWIDEPSSQRLTNFLRIIRNHSDYPSTMDIQCTLWSLMHLAIDAISTEVRANQEQGEGGHVIMPTANGETSYPSPYRESDIYTELFMALVRLYPENAFKGDCPAVNRHSHRDIRLSAMIKAIQKGSLPLVKYMIHKYLREGQTTTANSRLVQLMQTDSDDQHCVWHAISEYKRRFADNPGNYCLDMIEEFLNVEKSSREENQGSECIIDESLLIRVIRRVTSEKTWENSPSLRVIRLILEYRPDMKKKIIFEKTLERAHYELAEMVFTNAEVDKSTVEKIILDELVGIWALTREAIVQLIQQDKEAARELFRCALKKLPTSKPLDLQANGSGTESPAEERQNQPVFAEEILKMINILDSSIREDIIDHWRAWFWELPCVESLRRGELHNLCMLHLAVERQKVEAVDYFVKTDPESLLKTVEVPTLDRDEKKVYPLWHNNFYIPQGTHPSKPLRRPLEQQSSDPKIKDAREKIRKLLVDGVIQKADGMKSLAKIFRESGERAGLTCFDISTFTSRLNSVEEFIRSIRAISDKESNRHLTFEEVLRYADFPSLDVNQWEMKADKAHKEVFDALSWLRDQKGVKRILSLKVLDRMYRPHNERDIAVQTRIFEVETLDWRFLDMAISYLSDEHLTEKAIEMTSQQQYGEPSSKLPKERLRVLHLYSSGKRAAVDHWLGQNGIRTLPNLEILYIHLIQDLISEELISILQDTISKRIKTINKKRARKGRKKIEFEFVLQRWNSAPKNNIENLVEIAKRAVPEIYTYIEHYSSKFRGDLLNKKPVRRTRIAILDSGILTVPPSQTKRDENNGLWPRIAEGESFIDDDTRLPPWQFASDPHGTQIANVISAIDPHCEIYVAKVAEGRHGIQPDNVADAILWVIEKEVDIISMSFAIPQYSHNTNPNYARRLIDAVKKANDDEIIQLCSHHDEGWNVDKSWPADCEGVKTVVACNEYGAFTDRQPRDDYDYQIPGIDIFTGTVPYLESKDTMSGSSVATAIAAGLASLSLSCHRLQNGPDSIQNRIKFVEKEFRNMAVQSGSDGNDKKVYLRVEGFAKFAEAEEGGNPKYSWLMDGPQ